jgi:hypothetical protein
MHCYLALAALLTTHSCNALRHPSRMQAIHRRAVAAPSLARQPPRLQAIHRRAAAAPALAFLAALAVRPATALPPPEGCKWTGEGEYPGRKSGMDVKLINAFGLQRELREGVWGLRIHRHARHTRASGSPSKPKQGGIVYVLSGSAAAPVASAPSTAAAPRTSCAF